MSSSYSGYGNHYIKYGKITKSDIDQGSRPIINLPTPVNPQDAVPKSYVDALLNQPTSYPKIEFTLTGTQNTEVLSDTIGVKTILIFGVTDADSPMAIFNVVKNNSLIEGNVNRQISTAGITTLERLEVRWQAGNGIECRKTGTGYDGTYCAVVLETLTPVTLQTTNFVLNGTTGVTVDGDLTGIKSLLVKSNVVNAPYAKFIAAKNNSASIGQVSREIGSSGIPSGAVLECNWPINSGLVINKSTNDHDGTYTATFIYS